MNQEEVKLCEACWEDGLAARAYWYLSTLPVCEDHYACVCGRCHRQWTTALGDEGDGHIIGVCDSCREALDREAARRQAYNQHLSSEEWRKTKKALRSQSFTEKSRVICS